MLVTGMEAVELDIHRHLRGPCMEWRACVDEVVVHRKTSDGRRVWRIVRRARKLAETRQRWLQFALAMMRRELTP